MALLSSPEDVVHICRLLQDELLDGELRGLHACLQRLLHWWLQGIFWVQGRQGPWRGTGGMQVLPVANMSHSTAWPCYAAAVPAHSSPCRHVHTPNPTAGKREREEGRRRTRPFRLAEISELWSDSDGDLVNVCLLRW